MKTVEFNNIIKRYDDQLAINQVSFRIEAGEIFGLLGPNEAGKSTLISMLCGITSLDHGEIKVGDYSISKEPIKVKEIIGYVPQELAILESLTIKDNLEYFAGMQKIKGEVKKERIKEALEVTGLTERKSQKVKKLSGGMKRRLNIACALLHHPEVLIMDEPTVGIDPQSRNHILEFTRQLNKKYNTTIIYTSHYMEEIQSLCNQLMILDEGKVITCGKKEEILRSVINETKLHISVDKISDSLTDTISECKGVKKVISEENQLELIVNNELYKIEDIFGALRQTACKVITFSIEEPNLETVFLSLTGHQLRD